VKSKGYTVFIIPESTSSASIQLRLSLGMLLTVSLIGCLFIAGLLTLVWDISQQDDSEALLSENLELSHRYQELKHEISDLDRRMELLQIYSAQIEMNSPTGPWESESNDQIEDFDQWRTQLNRIRQQSDLLMPILLERAGKAAEETAKYSHIPRLWPLSGRFTSGFGYRKSPVTGSWGFHKGIDVAAPYGAMVTAPADGFVTRSHYWSSYGKTVELDHGYGIKTRFAHNSKLMVKVGQQVRAGDVIATVGSTGRSTGPHLHYEILIDGVAVDPMMYLHTKNEASQ